MKIKIEKDWYDYGEEIYNYDSISLKEGLTVLVGCNGSGKTTLIHQIKEHCVQKKIKCLHFNNLHDGGFDAMNRKMMYGNTSAFVNDWISSEGEKIVRNLTDFAGKIGAIIKELKPKDKLVILFDAIDSGLDIPNVIDTKQNFFDFVIKEIEKEGIKVFLVVACNEYEMTCDEKCLLVRTGKYTEFKNYNEYKREILFSYKDKMKRYGWPPKFNLKNELEKLSTEN